MNNADKEYLRLLELVLSKGRRKNNRTGIDTLGVFGEQARFDLSEGFPLLTTKRVFFKGVAHELLWFLSGSTNIKYLVDNGVHIWDDNAYDKYERRCLEIGKNMAVDCIKYDTKEVFINGIKTDEKFANIHGELGEGTYGGMWRAFPTHLEYYQEPKDGKFEGEWLSEAPYRVDQIQKVIESLTNNPDSRRHIVSAWHPYWVDHCALPPCHVMFQFYTEELTHHERVQIYLRQLFEKDGYGVGGEVPEGILNAASIPKRRLSCQLYQRSCDLFLGVPFNIASYALLTSMVAHVTNMVPGDFIHTFGDLHLYENHLDQAKEQLTREPKKLPTISLTPNKKDLFDFKYEDIALLNYNPHPAIKAEMAV